jgi:hypothetical protein
MIARNETFEGVHVALDGGSFYQCTFRSCDLAFFGTMPVHLDACTFEEGCRWHFGGNAALVIETLAGLHKAGATALIDRTFEQIRGKGAKGAH